MCIRDRVSTQSTWGYMDKEKAKVASAAAKEAFGKKDYAAAIKSYTEAISFDPTDHLLFSNRSACYASLTQYQDALDDANKCLELKPDFVRGYGRKGLALFYLKKHGEAIETYTAGLKLDPNNDQLKEGLEQAKSGMEEGSPFGSQKEILGKLLADPVTKEYFKDKDFIAKLQLCQQNPQMLIQLMQSDPRFEKVLEVITGINMADLKQKAGAPEGHEGHEHGHEGHEHSHEGHEHAHPPPPHFEPAPPKPEAEKPKPAPMSEEEKIKHQAEEEKKKGNDAYKAKNMETALEHYNEAIKIFNQEPIYHLNKALAYIEMKKYDECLKCCDEAIELAQTLMPKPFDKIAKAFVRKANCYTQMGKYPEAIAHYDKALLEVNDPATREAKKNCESFIKKQEEEKYLDPVKAEEHKEKGNVFFRDGNFAEAIKEYDESIKRNPKSAPVLLNRALTYMKMLEHGKALEDISRSLALDPKYAKAYAKKGKIHFFLKEYHKAIDAYNSGLAIEPTNEECLEGREKTQQAIYQSPPDEDRAKRAMADPEIRAILSDPRIQQVFKEIKENPSAPIAAMKDPFIAQAIQKLIAAGIIGTKQP
eukprot:TRINITY_DN1999_c0_g1_i1.p1 TRINITY_DN1999_c0_g1~~TRINITY_DN1999_c0_g1_i1.p1  ORF type:complete len:591 (+),score=196.13 TRINITY_DN1999_c0_g1_i1:70-1842(+)